MSMTLESVCKIYQRRCHLNGDPYSTRRTYLRYLFCFKLFKLYSNILKCVNLIELRFNVYLYATSFLVLWHIIFETTAQIPEVEFKCKIYGYLRANTNICGYFPWVQTTNINFYLLLDMQKRTYCNKQYGWKLQQHQKSLFLFRLCTFACLFSVLLRCLEMSNILRNVCKSTDTRR
jgi:hypothetical protein